MAKFLSLITRFFFRLASCTNCPCVDTTRALGGKAFGTFAQVMPEDTPFTNHNTTVEYSRLSFCGRSLTVVVVQQAPGDGSHFSIFGRVTTRKRNAFTAREASL